MMAVEYTLATFRNPDTAKLIASTSGGKDFNVWKQIWDGKVLDSSWSGDSATWEAAQNVTTWQTGNGEGLWVIVVTRNCVGPAGNVANFRIDDSANGTTGWADIIANNGLYTPFEQSDTEDHLFLLKIDTDEIKNYIRLVPYSINASFSCTIDAYLIGYQTL
jgi:hypothetical protein